jgi:hypothetical protein
MGQVHVRVVLTNHREAVMAQFGEHVLLGVTVLEELDLIVDCQRNQLVPYQGTQDQPVFRV